MAFLGYPHNFLNGLSAFWQRFFADADQLSSLYQGTTMLIGQAYLDMLANVLNVSLQDATVFNKEYYHLVTIREDEVHFERGASSSDDRWAFALPDQLVSFISLDNRVIEPTASLQQNNDYDLSATEIRFKVDPTDPAQTGVPMAGFARRQVDVAVGGAFDDTARAINETWMSRSVRKGDLLRVLDIGPTTPNPQQRRRADYSIVVVRSTALYVDTTTPLPAPATNLNFVILRQPFDSQVTLEPLNLVPAPAPTAGAAPGSVAQLLHTRIDQGSLKVYAKGPSGADVVEGSDYTVDYEGGKLFVLTSWQNFSPNKVDYTWRQEVFPLTGGMAPRYAATGTILSSTTTTRVIQLALWAPDALVDRGTLAANFGSLIGSSEASSEAYRAFLRGIFQLYVLGPVLERMESALNVILGLPVIRDDGEILQSVDQSQVTYNQVVTLRPALNTLATYDFPKATPLRTDIINPAGWGTKTFDAFEPLTTATTVTDYVETPTWWYNQLVPTQLFAQEGDGTVPTASRRTASPELVEHVFGAVDGPRYGDPGLVYGADEDGNSPATPGNPIYRHRLAFVLMDRYLKYHTFVVKFDTSVFLPNDIGVKFERSLDDLNRLIFSAKPAHTYIFVTPTTSFLDTIIIDDTTGDQYQPQRYLGADPDAPEIYAAGAPLPSGAPSVILGLFFPNTTVAGEPDQVLFADRPPSYGDVDLRYGDYYHYEAGTQTVSFPTPNVAVAVAGAPTPPRRGHFVMVYVAATKLAKRLIENVDYTVDYQNMTLTRTTTWDTISGVSVHFVMLNLGNTTDAAPDQTVGDVSVMHGAISPSLVRAAYDPAAVDLFDRDWPVADHRDFSLVERGLTVKVT